MGVNIRLAFQIDKKKPNNNYDGQDSFQYFARFISDGLRHDIRGLWSITYGCVPEFISR